MTSHKFLWPGHQVHLTHVRNNPIADPVIIIKDENSQDITPFHFLFFLWHNIHHYNYLWFFHVLILSTHTQKSDPSTFRLFIGSLLALLCKHGLVKTHRNSIKERKFESRNSPTTSDGFSNLQSSNFRLLIGIRFLQFPRFIFLGRNWLQLHQFPSFQRKRFPGDASPRHAWRRCEGKPNPANASLSSN